MNLLLRPVWGLSLGGLLVEFPPCFVYTPLLDDRFVTTGYELTLVKVVCGFDTWAFAYCLRWACWEADLALSIWIWASFLTIATGKKCADLPTRSSRSFAESFVTYWFRSSSWMPIITDAFTTLAHWVSEKFFRNSLTLRLPTSWVSKSSKVDICVCFR